MYNAVLADKLFEGWKTYVWLLLPTAYFIYGVWFLTPCLFSSIYVGWFFNPHLGYRDDLDHFVGLHQCSVKQRKYCIVLKLGPDRAQRRDRCDPGWDLRGVRSSPLQTRRSGGQATVKEGDQRKSIVTLQSFICWLFQCSD